VSDGGATSDGFNVLTEARYGRVLYNRHDIYIGRSLELYGEWSEGEISLFQQLLEPGMIAVDAGANIGTHTLALARIVGPTGAVIAFEPQRIVFQTLAANAALNSLTNVSCQQRALGEKLALVRVPPLNYTQDNNFGGLTLGEHWTVGETVEVIRIDDLNLAVCHLMKIDVEGMELEVLRGAAATIERCQPALYVELDRADKRDEVLRWLDERNYVVFGHDVPLYNPANFKANPTNVFEGILSLNALAVPAKMAPRILGLPRLAIPIPDGSTCTTAPPLPREVPNLGRPKLRAAKGRKGSLPPRR
jgi:FkbM family methyltransferase